jgi:hypothetical protein
MKIKNIEPMISVNKFKNKEDFCNRLIQEVVSICKNKLVSKSAVKKIEKAENHKNKLLEKNEKLVKLLEKSSIIQKDISEKLQNIIEENKAYKNKLLEMLENSTEIQK